MKTFGYGVMLQLRLGIRSRTMLVTCYVVPLIFFLVMGGIFTSLMPQARDTLTASMCVMGISMGALIGCPPLIAQIYGTPVWKMYLTNGMPRGHALLSILAAAFIHLLLMSLIIMVAAPLCFGARWPANVPLFLLYLALFIAVSLSVAGILGLLFGDQARLTMCTQLVFLPSILLSGIMFSATLLPDILEMAGKLFPATWGFVLLQEQTLFPCSFWVLACMLALTVPLNVFLLRRHSG